jgi:hypothetical protein
MPGLLRVLTPGTGASPRRGVLRALATVGAGSILGGLGAPSAEAKRKGKNKNKNKNKDKISPQPTASLAPPLKTAWIIMTIFSFA